MVLLSVVILSYGIDGSAYQMNCKAIHSLEESENWEDGALQVILMESCKTSSFQYGENVDVLMPEEQFNFHKYFNIGLDYSAGKYVAFCNNDIVFEKGWFSAILEVQNKHKRYKCFSPLDDKYPRMSAESLPRVRDHYCGWDYGKFFAPWCFVWRRDVFEIIGKFDETFDFYAADADETNTLRYYAIPSVVVTKSVVRHLAHSSVSKERKINNHIVVDHAKYPLTDAELRRGYQWLWDDDRYYSGYQKEKAKWGNIQMTRRVQKFLRIFPVFNIRPITKVLYSQKVNHLLCKLTGIEE